MAIDLAGFHVLKDSKCLTRSRMAEAATEICDHLDKYLSLTREAAQIRTNKLLRSNGRISAAEMRDKGERLLEATVIAAWGPETEKTFLDALCPWLLTKQVPLAAARAARGWGKVDLFGMSPAGEPVIIELKAGRAADSPLRAIIEGVGYAVSIRNNHQEYLGQLELPTRLTWASIDSGQATKIWVVVMAPEGFWAKLNRSKRSRGALPKLRSLAARLSNAGYPVRFSSVRGTPSTGLSDLRWWDICGHGDNGYWPFDPAA